MVKLEAFLFDCCLVGKKQINIPEAQESSYYLSVVFKEIFVVRPGKGSWKHPSLDMLEDAGGFRAKDVSFHKSH